MMNRKLPETYRATVALLIDPETLGDITYEGADLRRRLVAHGFHLLLEDARQAASATPDVAPTELLEA